MNPVLDVQASDMGTELRSHGDGQRHLVRRQHGDLHARGPGRSRHLHADPPGTDDHQPPAFNELLLEGLRIGQGTQGMDAGKIPARSCLRRGRPAWNGIPWQ